jgi:predicted DNA-binding transcriptional regulator AlpA
VQLGCMVKHVLPNYVTAADLAQAVSIHKKTVFKLAKAGVLPSLKLTPKCVRFPLAECIEALERRTREVAR